MKDNIITLSFAYETPKFVEKKGYDYIFYGEQNDYPEFLVNLFNTSAKHNAIVTGKCDYIAGAGVVVEKTLPLSERMIVDKKIDFINRNESLNELIKKLTLDLELFGGVAIEVIYNNKGEIAELYHIDFSYIRKLTDDSENDYAFTKEWNKRGRPNRKAYEEEDYEEYKAYDPNNPRGKQLFYYKDYRPNLGEYPLPEYVGAIPYIESDCELANYNIQRLKQGFTGGHIINFLNGRPEPEEMEIIERQITDKFTGSDNAGKVMLNFADGKEKAAEVIPLTPQNLDEHLRYLTDLCQEEIFIGHKVVSPMLFGVKTEGQLGGRTELLEANESFQNRYVRGKQRILNMILSELVSDKVTLGQIEPISYALSEQTLKEILPAEVLRDIAYKQLNIEENTKEAFNAEKVCCSSDIDELILSEFEKCGIDKDSCEIIFSKDLEYNEDTPIIDEEAFMSFALGVKLTDLQKAVLGILKNDPKTPIEVMAEELNTTPENVSEAIDKLIQSDALEINDNERVVKDKAKDEVEDEYKVVYSYEVRNGLPPLRTESRDFCKRMERTNKFFSRDEIDRLNAFTGHNTWLRRGGFYHNPSTGVTTPYCRHIWRSHLIKA